MNQLLSFCNENNLFLIEDCAQAHGAVYDGKRLGSIGDIGCFSCYPTKNLGAIGDAGLITTNSSSLAKKIRMIREYGWVDRISTIKGRNSRLDELQAAILNVKLKYLDKDNQKRNVIAEKYDSLLSDHMVTPIRRPESNHVFHLYVCRLPNRNQLKKFLEEKNIFPGIHYPVPIHLQPAYHEKIKLASPLKITEQIAHEILSLPMFPELSLENVDYIIETILLFYKDYKC
jgi:dTDP-4-amino-4,6-dideoxygalactose transaminase